MRFSDGRLCFLKNSPASMLDRTMGSAQLSKISIWVCRSSYTLSNVNVLTGSSGALGFLMLMVPLWNV